MDRINYYALRKIREKIEHEILGTSSPMRDGLEVAYETNFSYKYINERGELRLDLDYEIFEKLLKHAIKHSILCTTYVNLPDVDYKAIDKRLMRAWELSCVDSEVLRFAEDLYVARPLFDERKP